MYPEYRPVGIATRTLEFDVPMGTFQTNIEGADEEAYTRTAFPISPFRPFFNTCRPNIVESMYDLKLPNLEQIATELMCMANY